MYLSLDITNIHIFVILRVFVPTFTLGTHAWCSFLDHKILESLTTQITLLSK